MLNSKLTFSNGNAKLSNDTLIFSIPAGHTCPFAKDCKSHADKITGKITDGKDCKFRCYATTPECLFKSARTSRWHNFEVLKQAKTIIGMANAIELGIINKKDVKLVRIHSSGDFFNQNYFDAWLLVAKLYPHLTFYTYTKAMPFWAKRINTIPDNMKLVASYGGTHDVLINALNLRSVKVVFSEEEAKKLNLELDHDDCLAWKGDKDFAILLHGQQPKNSEAGKAWQKLIKNGTGGYKVDYIKKNKNKSVSIPVISIHSKFGEIKLGNRMNNFSYACHQE